jgi:hypothetical protein
MPYCSLRFLHNVCGVTGLATQPPPAAELGVAADATVALIEAIRRQTVEAADDEPNGPTEAAYERLLLALPPERSAPAACAAAAELGNAMADDCRALRVAAERYFGSDFRDPLATQPPPAHVSGLETTGGAAEGAVVVAGNDSDEAALLNWQTNEQYRPVPTGPMARARIYPASVVDELVGAVERVATQVEGQPWEHIRKRGWFQELSARTERLRAALAAMAEEGG